MPARQRVSRMLLALVAGLVVGIVVGATHSGGWLSLLHFIAPLGSLWINAIRMTVVPLVVALLFTSIVGSDRTRVIGRQAKYSVVTFLAILFLATALAWLLAPPLMHDLKVTAATSAALRATAIRTVAAAPLALDQLPGFRDWVTGLVPSNAFRAAVDGAMLPLIVFTLLFALAARQIPADRRATLTTFFSGIAEAMQVIVGWTIRIAPIGIFCLIAAPAAESGTQIAGAIGYYVLSISLVLILFTLLMYPLAHFAGVHLARFARAVLPAQAVAMASSSSLASLPALLTGAQELGISRPTADFVLPLSVGAFKAATPISWTVGTLFVARLYGVPVGPGTVLGLAITALVLSFGIPGVPQGSLLVLAGFLPGMGIPAEGVALLMAADTIPDLFGTLTNVTADMVVATTVAQATGDFGVRAEDMGGLAAGPAAADVEHDESEV